MSHINKNIGNGNSNINMSIMNDSKKGLGSKKLTAELSDHSSHYQTKEKVDAYDVNLKKSLDKVETGYLRNTPMRNKSMI